VDRPFHGRASSGDFVDALGVERDRDHIDVDLRRESPVEPHFCVTGFPPFFESREVEEAQVDRTLDLEHVRCAQEDPGDVCLDQFEACRFEVRFQHSHHVSAQRGAQYTNQVRAAHARGYDASRNSVATRSICARFAPFRRTCPRTCELEWARHLLPVRAYHRRER